MVRVAILGATGYTALELIKLLLHHPEAKITALTSRQEGRPHVSAIHPSLTGRLDLPLEDLGPEAVAQRCECAFLCLPHAASAESAVTTEHPHLSSNPLVPSRTIGASSIMRMTLPSTAKAAG